MASNDGTIKRRLMEELASALIGLCTVSRLTKISYFRIEQEIMNDVYRRLLWWPQHNYQTGSMFEGMPLNVCSDHDLMISKRIFPIVLWESEEITERHRSGYVMAEHNAIEPVFIRLRRVVEDENLHVDIRSIIDNDGYLKTDDFVEYNRKGVNEYSVGGSQRHGPSLASKVSIADNGDIILTDNVFCLKCQSWPSFTSDFFNRKRQNNWPSPKLLSIVYQLQCLVVAVGHPNSTRKDIEWRLSFSLAERELIHKMHGPYAKCMYALKSVKNKYIVYDESDTPTPFCSYFIKTACLWMCETCPREDHTVMDLIRKVIDWLVDSYQQRYLKHYFIPKQNLIGHLSSERCDGVIARLTAIKRDLWKMVMSSVPIPLFVRDDVINVMCDQLRFTRVNEADDYKTLESNLVRHPRAAGELKRAVQQLLLSGSMYDTYRYLENAMWAAKDFPSLLRAFEALRTISSANTLEVLRLPEEIMLPIIDNIGNVVLEGCVKFFKQRLYRFIGDVYTYLLLHFRRAGNALHCKSLFLDKPLHYYELGAEMEFPDKWGDHKIGGRAVIIIYHYLMNDSIELKEKLSTLRPILLTVNEDRVLMNRQINVEISTPFSLAMDAWRTADEMLHHFAKARHRILLHPIALVFYINARVSLKEGNTEHARLMVTEMGKCLKTILRHDVQATTKLLITIIESLIGLLNVFRVISRVQ